MNYYSFLSAHVQYVYFDFILELSEQAKCSFYLVDVLFHFVLASQLFLWLNIRLVISESLSLLEFNRMSNK